MSRLPPVFLLLAIPVVVCAGEVRHVDSSHSGGEYNLELTVLIEGDIDTVYAITTDYDQMTGLNEMIRASEVISRDTRDEGEVIRRRIETRTCVLIFCFDAVVVEDLREPEYGLIKTVFVPEQGDFEYGESEWRMEGIDETHTLISYTSKFKPAFWVPPLVGPMIVKRKMLNAAEETIQKIESVAAGKPLRP